MKMAQQFPQAPRGLTFEQRMALEREKSGLRKSEKEMTMDIPLIKQYMETAKKGQQIPLPSGKTFEMREQPGSWYNPFSWNWIREFPSPLFILPNIPGVPTVTGEQAGGTGLTPEQLQALQQMR